MILKKSNVVWKLKNKTKTTTSLFGHMLVMDVNVHFSIKAYRYGEKLHVCRACSDLSSCEVVECGS